MVDTEQEKERGRFLAREGARLLSLGRPGEAAQALEEAQRIMPDDVDVAINLGGAYVMQRRWRKAVHYLEAATKRWPGHAMLWMNLAAAYLGPLELSSPESRRQAIAAYEQALLCDPTVAQANYNLGLIYKEQKDYQRAAAHFWRALELDPLDEDARWWLKHLPLKNPPDAQNRDNDGRSGNPGQG